MLDTSLGSKSVACVNQTTTYYNDQQRSLLGLEILRRDVLANLDVVSIENVRDGVLMWLDNYSGVDWVCRTPANQIFSIAARIQFDRDWRTFTVRYKRPTGSATELEKRLDAVKNDFFYPTYTLQAYIDENKKQALSCGIVKTKVLYKYILENLDSLQIRTNKKDGVQFVFVKWDDVPDVIIKEPKIFF